MQNETRSIQIQIQSQKPGRVSPHFGRLGQTNIDCFHFPETKTQLKGGCFIANGRMLPGGRGRALWGWLSGFFLSGFLQLMQMHFQKKQTKTDYSCILLNSALRVVFCFSGSAIKLSSFGSVTATGLIELRETCSSKAVQAPKLKKTTEKRLIVLTVCVCPLGWIHTHIPSDLVALCPSNQLISSIWLPVIYIYMYRLQHVQVAASDLLQQGFYSN